MSERAALLEEANELGLEFASNVSSTKLQSMVDEAKGVINVATGDNEIPEVPAKKLTKRQKIGKAREAAFKTRVVTVTNKDSRDSAETNTAHLSFENNYFGIAKNVPLDIPVELEAALIKIAAAAVMPLHKKEYVDGKPTGNMVTVMVKKYAISYGE